MSYLSSSLRVHLQQQIELKETQLAAANTAYLAALGNSEIESYKFDSGEGRQETVRRSPAAISKEIRLLEGELQRLYRRLEGSGLVNLNLRRRRYVR